jgi:hypothetical protein
VSIGLATSAAITTVRNFVVKLFGVTVVSVNENPNVPPSSPRSPRSRSVVLCSAMLERRALKMSDPGGERQPIVKKGLTAGHAPEAMMR